MRDQGGKVHFTGPVMKRCFFLPEITLDRSASSSLRQQIHSQVAAAIRGGTVADGAYLPSSRLLAKLLHVSRNTVVDSYEDLLEDGLIRIRPGSGVQVSRVDKNVLPIFSNLRRTAEAAHYPVRTVQFGDPDGTALYLNATR
jgi:GntR family transcriptional regulator/MocR family aminotransferase